MGSGAEPDLIRLEGSERFSDAIEFAELAAGLRLFATLFDAWFLVVLPAFQFSFDAVNLQFFLQLSDGVLEIAANFNFNHLGAPLNELVSWT